MRPEMTGFQPNTENSSPVSPASAQSYETNADIWRHVSLDPIEKDLPIQVTVRASPGHNMNEGLFNVWLKAFAVEAKATADRPVVLILHNPDSHITRA
jgi:hypothetical protein